MRKIVVFAVGICCLLLGTASMDATSFLPVRVVAVGADHALAYAAPPGTELVAFPLAGGAAKVVTRRQDLGDTRYDAAKREYWGTGFDAHRGGSFVWTWSPGRAQLDVTPFAGLRITHLFQLPSGERLVACTPTSARNDAPITVNRWTGSGPLMPMLEAPHAAAFPVEPPFFTGRDTAAEGGGSVLLAFDPPRVVAPHLAPLPRPAPPIAWAEAYLAGQTWLLCRQDTAACWLSRDDARSWEPRATVRAPGDSGMQRMLLSLDADPYHPDCIYALGCESGPNAECRFIQLFVSEDLAATWSLVAPSGTEDARGWPSSMYLVWGPFFTPTGAWTEIDDISEVFKENWTLHLLRVAGGPPKTLLLSRPLAAGRK